MSGVEVDIDDARFVAVDLGRDELARFGTLAMIGNTTKPVDVVVKPPKKPRRVLVNARGEVLARE